jgi:hypothetical protein
MSLSLIRAMNWDEGSCSPELAVLSMFLPYHIRILSSKMLLSGEQGRLVSLAAR